MFKIGVADYGMHVWFGGMYDYEKRMEDLKKIGYDGIERLSVEDADDVMRRLVCLAKIGMDFATCETKNIERTIKWTAALGKKYVWANKSAYIRPDFDAYCRTTEYLCRACADYGIRAAVHNHLGSLVETQEQLEEFLRRCPSAGLLLDTGHLGVAGGDVLGIAENTTTASLQSISRNGYRPIKMLRSGRNRGISRGSAKELFPSTTRVL